MVRIITVFLIVIWNIIFQSTIVQKLSIGGISFNLLIITVVSIALIRGKLEGAMVGFAVGFLQDIFFGSTIGFYALLYMYFGFFCGFLNKTFYRDNVLIPIFIIAGSDFLLNFLIYIFTYLFRGRTELSYYLKNIIVPELVYTTFVCVIFYKLYLYINDKVEFFEKRKENQT